MKKSANKSKEIDFSKVSTILLSSNRDNDDIQTENFKKHLCFILNLKYSDNILDNYGITVESKLDGGYYHRKIESLSVKIVNPERGRRVPYYKTIMRLTTETTYDLGKFSAKFEFLKDYVEERRFKVETEQEANRKEQEMNDLIESCFPKQGYFKFNYTSVDITPDATKTTIDLRTRDLMQKLKNAEINSPEIYITEKNGKKEFTFDYSVNFRHSPSKSEFTNAVIDLNAYVEFVNKSFEQIIESLKKSIK